MRSLLSLVGACLVSASCGSPSSTAAAPPAATSSPATHPVAAQAESTESLLTVPAGTFTPDQIEMARRDIEFTKSITKWEASSTGAYITFRYGNYTRTEFSFIDEPRRS